MSSNYIENAPPFGPLTYQLCSDLSDLRCKNTAFRTTFYTISVKRNKILRLLLHHVIYSSFNFNHYNRRFLLSLPFWNIGSRKKWEIEHPVEFLPPCNLSATWYLCFYFHFLPFKIMLIWPSNNYIKNAIICLKSSTA